MRESACPGLCGGAAGNRHSYYGGRQRKEIEMFDVTALQTLLEPLGWFLTLGKSDTKEMRTEIQELLHHTGQSVRTLIELETTLAGLNEQTLTKDSFYNVYLHCKYTYTGNDAPELARTHCSDIRRDIRRISFKAAKLFRTEWGEWKNVGNSFSKLENADLAFLEEFGSSLRRVDAELDVVNDLLKKDDKAAAWTRFSGLRDDIRSDVESLRTVIERLRQAEDHIRLVLT